MYSSNPNEFQKSPMPLALLSPPPSIAYSQQPETNIQVKAPNYMRADHMPQVPAPSQTQTPGRWSTGLFGCHSDICNYCITCWCPCITFGQIADIVDKGSSPCVASAALYCLIAHFTGCPCLYSFTYRSKMRQQYNLLEQPCGDCLVHFCCERCALRQEYRELKNRGFDMSIGWQGNMEKQNGGATIAPNVQGGMNR